jgi:hypothetical protein
MKPARESLAGFKTSAKKAGESARQSLAGLESGARDVGTGAIRAVGRFSEGFPIMRRDLSDKPAPPPRTTSRDRDQGWGPFSSTLHIRASALAPLNHRKAHTTSLNLRMPLQSSQAPPIHRTRSVRRPPGLLPRAASGSHDPLPPRPGDLGTSGRRASSRRAPPSSESSRRSFGAREEGWRG